MSPEDQSLAATYGEGLFALSHSKLGVRAILNPRYSHSVCTHERADLRRRQMSKTLVRVIVTVKIPAPFDSAEALTDQAPV
jgi:hypothetical protein